MIANIISLYFWNFRSRTKAIKHLFILACKTFSTLSLPLQSSQRLRESRRKAEAKQGSDKSNAWGCCHQNRDSWKFYRRKCETNI